MTQPIHVHFWAKTTDGDRPGISVSGHMENVGCVAFIRRHGLAGTVTVPGDVDSCDIYTRPLMDKFVSRLEDLGWAVSVPSATGMGRRGNQIVGEGDEDDADAPCPLVTGSRWGGDSQRL